MRILPLACAPPLAVMLACSGQVGPPLPLGAPAVDRDVHAIGAPDRGFDPAVVAIDVAGQGTCAGALIAPDVVLTARRCVDLPVGDSDCPAHGGQVEGTRDLTTLRVLVGDDLPTAVERARGRAVRLPPGNVLCGGDLAVLLLDATIDDVEPLSVRATGAAAGDHVRSTGFLQGTKRVRDHVPVTAVSSAEVELGEAPCRTSPGSVVIDEATGEVVGVVSRSAPSCDDAGADVATRGDAFLDLIAPATAAASARHPAHQAKGKKGPVDLGASCTQGGDCAAGACVTYASAQYCSRTCGPVDPCPSRFRCMTSQQGDRVCVEE